MKKEVLVHVIFLDLPFHLVLLDSCIVLHTIAAHVLVDIYHFNHW